MDSKVVKLYRISHYFYLKKRFFLSKIVRVIIRILFSAEIPPSCLLGKNIQIKHGGLGVVLHDNLVVGEDCVIYQNVTIGGREKSGTPKIGNNVYIGAGACILGNVKIGNNVKIGANSVVIKDVSDGETVVGIPAYVIRR
ncbi:serine O-acetyltransferase [Shewanella sp. 5_MG-2023]|uniref:serine O-acetyltransferase n=1 Tax=Shewanella sp. 5_MG-2023 TaxID=3062656 RepID=UPI0026E2429C|nr:serine O-acetyltransferase [Shewanella sp. 5_MG-2023]MDO6639187.1 serine O-acetyltransferase [Shewanella sp. 5_MG-2023]